MSARPHPLFRVLWTVNSVPSRIMRSSRLMASSMILLADTWSSLAEQKAMAAAAWAGQAL
jgi:hypothetical protein